MAMSFTIAGGGQYIDYVLPSGVSRMTLNCWIYPISLSGYVPIMSLRGGSTVNRYAISVDTTVNKVVLDSASTLYNTFAYSTNTLIANSWNMVTATITSATLRTISLNAVTYTDTDTQSGMTLNRPLVGAYFDNGTTTPTWNGYIAEVALWSQDFNQSEINALYAGAKPYHFRAGQLRMYVPGVSNINTVTPVTSTTLNGSIPFVTHVRRLG